MTALTRGKNTPFRYVDQIAFPVAANTHIFEGGVVQRAAAGGGIFPARSGSAGDENLVIVGVADETVDNNPGLAGARTCLVRLPHNCLFEIATSSDLALANIGDLYDILDDQTLQATANNAAPGGRLVQIVGTRLGWFDLFDTFTRP